EPAAFAPSGLRSPKATPASRAACAKSLAWTASRCRRRTRPCDMASVGAKARRAERAFLTDWDRTRPKRRPRHLGADEIHRGKRQKFYTLLSDPIHGEVIGLAPDRTEESLAGLLTTTLASSAGCSLLFDHGQCAHVVWGLLTA